MAASSGGLATAAPVPLDVKIGRIGSWQATARCLELRKRGIRSCCSDSGGNVAGGEMIAEDWRRPESKKCLRRVQTSAIPVTHFPSRRRSQGLSKQQGFYPRCSPKNLGPQSRDTPPERDTGIASEKEWGINLLDGNSKESGTNDDGSTWYRESGEDMGDNGYRCRWTRMGGQSKDDSSEWTETWWEKSDWTGYKELGAEKWGRNAQGDSWWETWQEVLYQDEWSNLARIERSAKKQAKSGTENARWSETWWEKYDAKGSTEKGAYKCGRLNEQSWWEKWGENYDGRGYVLKWTDKWAETRLGTKWGDKWEEKFFSGIGSRQGETWHVSPTGQRKCTNMVKAQLEKVGILLWMRRHTTRLNLTMDGLMLWAIQTNCYQLNLRRGRQVYILQWISGRHHHHRRVICGYRHQTLILHHQMMICSHCHRHQSMILSLMSLKLVSDGVFIPGSPKFYNGLQFCDDERLFL